MGIAEDYAPTTSEPDAMNAPASPTSSQPDAANAPASPTASPPDGMNAPASPTASVPAPGGEFAWQQDQTIDGLPAIVIFAHHPTEIMAGTGDPVSSWVSETSSDHGRLQLRSFPDDNPEVTREQINEGAVARFAIDIQQEGVWHVDVKGGSPLEGEDDDSIFWRLRDAAGVEVAVSDESDGVNYIPANVWIDAQSLGTLTVGRYYFDLIVREFNVAVEKLVVRLAGASAATYLNSNEPTTESEFLGGIAGDYAPTASPPDGMNAPASPTTSPPDGINAPASPTALEPSISSPAGGFARRFLPGPGLGFDAASERVEVAGNAAINGLFKRGGTIIARFNPASDGGNNIGRIVDALGTIPGGSGWALNVEGQSSETLFLRFAHNFSTTKLNYTTSSNDVLINQHNLVVLSWNGINGAGLSVRVNGVKVGLTQVTDASGDINADTSAKWIGESQVDDRHFDGVMHQIMLINHALSDAEALEFERHGSLPSGRHAGSQVNQADAVTTASGLDSGRLLYLLTGAGQSITIDGITYDDGALGIDASGGIQIAVTQGNVSAESLTIAGGSELYYLGPVWASSLGNNPSQARDEANALHGTIFEATPLATPEAFSIDDPVGRTTDGFVLGDTEIIPAGYRIDSVSFEEVNGVETTVSLRWDSFPGINLTTSTVVVASETTLATLSDAFHAATSPQKVYLTGVSASGAKVITRIQLKKI